MTLYDIAGEILDIQRALEEADPELAAHAIEAYLRDNAGTLEQKVDGYCALIRNLEALADARAQEAKRMQELALSDKSKVARLKEMLVWFLKDVAGIPKLDTERFRVSVAANGGKAPLVVPDDPSAWPKEFVRERVIRELDREALREALEHGEQVDGCAIADRGYHVRIR